MITCRVEFEPLSLANLDAGEQSERIGQAMRDHWQGEAFGGKRSDGRTLPRNRKGMPLGIGRGTIVGGRPAFGTWSVKRLRSSRVMGATAVEPFQGGRYAIAVRMLMRRGIVYHTLRGTAGKAFKAALKREAAEVVRVLGGGR